VLARESEGPDPETEQLQKAQAQMVNEAIEKLPIEFREVVVLRELEELSYKEIAVVLEVPIGTVMSRLARARKRLMLLLQGATDYTDKESDFQSVPSVAGITGPLH
jgi:RNA polymerase sigma-70 factor (ECF subfamily)